MVVFDTSTLLLVLDPKASPPTDPDTGKPVERAAERIENLISKLTADREQIIIPTPVLSEVLVHAGAATSEYLDILNKQACFRIAAFDQKAALETALSLQDALARGNIKVDAANQDASRTKVKFDRQIVAIGKVEGAHTIFSDDADVHAYAERCGLKALRTRDLELPPEDPQPKLDF